MQWQVSERPGDDLDQHRGERDLEVGHVERARLRDLRERMGGPSGIHQRRGNRHEQPGQADGRSAGGTVDHRTAFESDRQSRQTVGFTAAASGTLIRRWSGRSPSNGGTTWIDIVGNGTSTSAELSGPGFGTFENGWEVRAVFTNVAGCGHEQPGHADGPLGTSVRASPRPTRSSQVVAPASEVDIF